MEADAPPILRWRIVWVGLGTVMASAVTTAVLYTVVFDSSIPGDTLVFMIAFSLIVAAIALVPALMIWLLLRHAILPASMNPVKRDLMASGFVAGLGGLVFFGVFLIGSEGWTAFGLLVLSVLIPVLWSLLLTRIVLHRSEV